MVLRKYSAILTALSQLPSQYVHTSMGPLHQPLGSVARDPLLPHLSPLTARLVCPP